VPPTRRETVKKYGEEGGYGAIRAIDPATAERKWEFRLEDVTDSGIVTTAADLLFTGSREGHVFVLDARNGKRIWSRYLGGQIIAGPVSYAVGGNQYFTVAAGSGLFTFGLR
jgi:alcohol dehydrogenase (cytochrome c)